MLSKRLLVVASLLCVVAATWDCGSIDSCNKCNAQDLCQWCGNSCTLIGDVFAGCLVPDVCPEVTDRMSAIVRSQGFPVEKHYVTTADDYILGVYRIPKPGAPVAFLQHGLVDSSFTWVNNPADQSLGFILSSAGYDVWFGNSRGNVYSLNATFCQPDCASSKRFWNFNWDQMAQYDLPASIDYVLQATGKESLSYIGHSQGTTIGFASFINNDALSQKVNVFAALAPVAYVYHTESDLLRALADINLGQLLADFGTEMFPPAITAPLMTFLPNLCAPKIFSGSCENLLWAIVGHDPNNNLNQTRLPIYLAHTPTTTSLQDMRHWTQMVQVDAFQHYDYGTSEANTQAYGTATPPLYHLDEVSVPVGLFSGGLDDLADPIDVATLQKSLPASTVVTALQIPTYDHMDFVWGENAHTELYPHVINLLNKYNGGSPLSSIDVASVQFAASSSPTLAAVLTVVAAVVVVVAVALVIRRRRRSASTASLQDPLL